jgi:hypothetical protein
MAGLHPRFGVAFLSVVTSIAILFDGEAVARSGGHALVERSHTVAGNAAADARFGEALAMQGATAFVGAPGASSATGRVYVLEEQGGQWVETTQLTAGASAPGDLFGSSVAIDDDTLIIGAPSADAIAVDAGAVVLFEHDGTAWVETATLTAFDAASGDGFGTAVDIDGDTLVIGAAYVDASPVEPDNGAAFVFVRVGTQWSFQAKLTSVNQRAHNRHGFSVAVSGEHVFVGAPGLPGDTGFVWAFERTGSSWGSGVYTVFPFSRNGQNQGASLAADGDRFIAGQPADGLSPSGFAGVFAYDGSSWTNEARLFPDTTLVTDQFGFSVALDGDRALIAARSNDTGGTGAGAVYLYERQAGTWRQSDVLMPSSPGLGDTLAAVAISGDRALAGAPLNDDGGLDAGRIYGIGLGEIYTSTAPDQSVGPPDPPIDGDFAASVDGSGDRVLVGAPQFCLQAQGFVYVRTGSGWILESELNGPWSSGFGYSVSLDGDTALVGAPIGSNGDCFIPGTRGELHFYERQGPHWTLSQTMVASRPRGWVGAAVDLDGDTAVAGEPRSESNRGTGYVIVRNGTQWIGQAELVGTDSDAGDEFGSSLCLEGNTAVFGAPLDGAAGTSSGSAYVFERIGTVWTQTAKLTASDAAPFMHFSEGLAISGDTIAVGAPGQGGQPGNRGAVYIFVRDGAGWVEQAKITTIDGRLRDFLGAAVSLEGDRLVATAPGDDSAYVFVRVGTSWIMNQKLLTNGATSDCAMWGDDVALGVEFEVLQQANLKSVGLFTLGGAFASFCNASDGALSSCPCGNQGLPDTGCDLPQETGGVRLDVLAKTVAPVNRATFIGTGFPPATSPSATLIRSPGLDPNGPVVFGDGLRCLGVPLVRVGSGTASGGSATFETAHGAMAGAGTFLYQLHLRSTPVMFCDPAAAFNLSSGRAITWP